MLNGSILPCGGLFPCCLDVRWDAKQRDHPWPLRSPLVNPQFTPGSPEVRRQPPAERPKLNDVHSAAVAAREPDGCEAVSEGARVARAGDRKIEKFHGASDIWRWFTGGAELFHCWNYPCPP